MIAAIAAVWSCGTKSDYHDIPTDSVAIARGEAEFTKNCSACHNFKSDGIGPQLGGVTERVSATWLRSFIRDPESVVESGDERGQKLLARFKTMMPSFSQYTDSQLGEIIAYLRTQSAPEAVPGKPDSVQALADPLPGGITPSNLVAELEFVAEIPASSNQGFKTRITKLDFIPGTERILINDIRGKLHELRGGKPEVYMDMAVLKSGFIDAPGLATGFGSFAFHPEFLKNGLLYTGHTESPSAAKADFTYADSIRKTVQWVITEWKTNTPEKCPFTGTSRELFRIDMVTGMHGVQELTFNPGSKPGDDDYGLLYIGIGDGACVQYGARFLMQGFEKPWGSIFRIDPRGNNSANGNYGIPKSNPFSNSSNPEAVREVYAYGFRNPHRITWTSSGQMLASNIGQGNIESVNLIEPGHNYGWPIREGTFVVDPTGNIEKVYPLPEDDAKYGITYPVAQYDHDDGAAISGGFEYLGDEIPALKNKYLFADMNNGRLYYIDLSEVRPGRLATIREWKITHKGELVTTAQLHGSKRVDLRLGRDHKGNVYLFSKQDGKVYRLARATSDASSL